MTSNKEYTLKVFSQCFIPYWVSYCKNKENKYKEINKHTIYKSILLTLSILQQSLLDSDLMLCYVMCWKMFFIK